MTSRGASCWSGVLASAADEQVFEGEVVGLIGAGAFVAFGEHGQFEGLLPVRRLRGDWWELNEEGTILVGTRNGGAIRLGDPVRGARRADRRAAGQGGPAARVARRTDMVEH